MNASYPPAYRVGYETEVIYNVDDPSDAAVNSFGELWLVATLLGAATVLVAVILGSPSARCAAAKPPSKATTSYFCPTSSNPANANSTPTM